MVATGSDFLLLVVVVFVVMVVVVVGGGVCVAVSVCVCGYLSFLYLPSFFSNFSHSRERGEGRDSAWERMERGWQ